MQIVSAKPCFGWSQPACSQCDLCFPRKPWPGGRGREQARREGKKVKVEEKELCVSSHAQQRVASGMYWSFAVMVGGIPVRINICSLAGCRPLCAGQQVGECGSQWVLGSQLLHPFPSPF